MDKICKNCTNWGLPMEKPSDYMTCWLMNCKAYKNLTCEYFRLTSPDSADVKKESKRSNKQDKRHLTVAKDTKQG